MVIKFELNEKEALVIRRLAYKAGIRPSVFASNIIKGWIKGQARGSYLKIFNKYMDHPDAYKIMEELLGRLQDDLSVDDLNTAVSKIVHKYELKRKEEEKEKVR